MVVEHAIQVINGQKLDTKMTQDSVICMATTRAATRSNLCTVIITVY